MTGIEYKTAKGATVKIRIETETENLADSNFKSPCFDFIVEVSPYGNIGPVTFKNGIFQARSPRTVAGKLVKVAVLASPEAAALYAEYEAEVSRRVDSDHAASVEYEKHHAAVTAMMNR